MLAGLSTDERAKLNLEGYSPNNLRYLQHGDTRQDVTEDATRYVIILVFFVCIHLVNVMLPERNKCSQQSEFYINKINYYGTICLISKRK